MQVNPIVIKDLKLKMRNFKTSALTMKYLGILGIIALIAFLPQITYWNNYVSFSPQVVASTYILLSLVQYIMIVIITPLIISDAINYEKEENTIDLILCTSFSPFSLILGKTVVSMVQIFLLIITSLPIMATVFLYGGISIVNLCELFVFYLASALMVASISIFYSTLLKTLRIYRLLTYITSVILIGGINQIIIYGFYLSRLTDYFQQHIQVKISRLLSINPVYGFGSVIDRNSIPFLDNPSENQGSILPPMLLGLEIKPWLLNIVIYFVIANILLFFSARNINPIKKFVFRKSR